MKFFPVIQNSDEWFECRRGIPTSSCFSQIINPETCMKERSKYDGALDIHNEIKNIKTVSEELGVTEGTIKNYLKKYTPDTEPPEPELLEGAETYAHLLIAEILKGCVLRKFEPSYYMERGALMEKEAADYYEFETGYRVDRGGFMTDDLLRWGSSPDRRVLDLDGNVIGALEIKCPAPWTHVENLLSKGIDKKYTQQVQGQMLTGETLQFVDWVSYDDTIKPKILRVERDNKYIDILEIGLTKFDKMMNDKYKELIELGVLDSIPQKTIPDITDEIEELMAG